LLERDLRIEDGDLDADADWTCGWALIGGLR
jgi:hypothetical protein